MGAPKLIFLVLLTLAACAPPAPEPSPQATQEMATVADRQIYYPVFFYDPCGRRLTKLGLAYSYPGWMLNRLADALCVPADTTIRTWSPAGDPTMLSRAAFLPTLWGDGQIDDFVSHVPAGYVGYVLVANEPDQADQAALSPAQTAALFIAAHTHCPGCKLIGPGLASDETDGQWRLAWWQSFVAQGGQPEWVAAWDAHQYIAPEHAQAAYQIWGAGECSMDDLPCLAVWELGRRLDIIAATMPVSRPVVVSEVGGCSTWAFIEEWLPPQLALLESRPDVLWFNVFVDDTYHPEYQPCPYHALEVGGGWQLSAYGRAIRGPQWDGEPLAEEAYP